MENKITRNHVKAVVSFVVARSVSTVIVAAVSQNVQSESRLQLVELYIGAYALGAMVGKSSRKFTDEAVDSIATVFDQIKQASVTS